MPYHSRHNIKDNLFYFFLLLDNVIGIICIICIVQHIFKRGYLASSVDRKQDTNRYYACMQKGGDKMSSGFGGAFKNDCTILFFIIVFLLLFVGKDC